MEKKEYRRFWIGVDIGKEGAIVIQETDKNNVVFVYTHKMPKVGTDIDVQALHKILEPLEGGNGMVVFEKIIPYKENKSTAFSLGLQSGYVEMALVALSIPFVKVIPRSWQKVMFSGVEEMQKADNSRDTKAMALVAAKRRFPSVKLTFGEKATKPHDGLVDALLMSEYAKNI